MKKTRKEILLGFRARMKMPRRWYNRLADFLTDSFGTTSFLIVNALFFLFWILINTGTFPTLKIFDPYPFNFLTMFVSLEAIFLAVVVLISQKRQNDIADMRDELNFEINVRTEAEITRALQMLDEIHDHLGLAPEDDDELTEMKKSIDIEKLGSDMRKNSSK